MQLTSLVAHESDDCVRLRTMPSCVTSAIDLPDPPNAARIAIRDLGESSDIGELLLPPAPAPAPALA